MKMEHPRQADRKVANKAAPVTPVAAAVKGGMPTPKSVTVTPKASPGPGSNNEHGVSASKKELVVPSKAQSIVARMRQIPVPKPSSRPVTPKTEPAGDAPGFATPPPPAKASTPVPSPVSPPVTPTVRESPGTLILIDLEEPVAPTVSEREAAASAQVGGGSGEKQAPLAEEREPQKDAPEVEALPKESAKATDLLPQVVQESSSSDGSFDRRSFSIRLQGELEKLGGEQLSELCEAARRHPDLPRLLCNELGIEEWSAEGREAIKEFGEAEPLDELLWFHTEIAEEQALKDVKAAVDTTPSPAPAKTTPPPAPATTTPPPPAKSTPLQPPAKSTPPQPPAKSTGAGGGYLERPTHEHQRHQRKSQPHLPPSSQ